jgi:hypothetical protein
LEGQRREIERPDIVGEDDDADDRLALPPPAGVRVGFERPADGPGPAEFPGRGLVDEDTRLAFRS